jgi:hypothetical protein
MPHKVGDLVMAYDWREDDGSKYASVGIITKINRHLRPYRYKIDWVDGGGMDTYTTANVDSYRKNYIKYVKSRSR